MGAPALARGPSLRETKVSEMGAGLVRWGAGGRAFAYTKYVEAAVYGVFVVNGVYEIANTAVDRICDSA